MKKLFLFTLFNLVTYFVSAQITDVHLSSMLDSFSIKMPQEKCYIQTDRTLFFEGDNILFKSYFTLFEKPSILSKVGYVVFTDLNGKIIEKQMLKIKAGSATGTISIPSNLKSGTYFLKGFTLWMLNFPDLIYTKKIQIVNTIETAKAKTKIELKVETSINFYPEGGQILNGIDNLIAFKAINKFGIPVKIEGEILNQNKETVAKITSKHFGMGLFNLKPIIGGKYYAVLKDEFGTIITKELPTSINEGVSIHADNLNEKKVFVNINRAENNKEKFTELILIAQQNNKLVYYANLNLDEGLDAVAINKKNLTNGILQITVLTKTGVPISERLVFVNNTVIDTTEKILSSKINLSNRTKNTLTIDVSNYTNPDMALSILNYEIDSLESDNLLSSSYLTNLSKELIYKPFSYLKSNNYNDKFNIDLLMLTNGWRKINWKEILDNKQSEIFYPFEQSLNITGKILANNDKTNLKQAKINFIIKGIDSTTIQSQVNIQDKSEFGLDNLDFTKSATVYYQGSNLKREEALVSVKINPHFFDTLNVFKHSNSYDQEQNLDNNAEQFKAVRNIKSNRIKLLDSVFLKTKVLSATEKLNSDYVTDIFNLSDQTLIPNGNYFDVWQFLQRSVPGIKIDKAVSGTKVNFSRYDGLDYFNQTDDASNVQFFLNEVQVSVDIIDAINPSDIALIKVYKGVSGIALGLDRGGIAIYTNKNSSVRDWRSKGFDFFVKKGYSSSVEYFNMDYSKIKLTDNFIDIRPTIYWNANLKPIDGKLNVDFYNDDTVKKYKIVLEGIDENGKLLHEEKIVK